LIIKLIYDNLENTYNNIEEILKKAFYSDEFVNIIIYTNFIVYIILKIAIKKFKLKTLIFMKIENLNFLYI
jgi:hypothetical protein